MILVSGAEVEAWLLERGAKVPPPHAAIGAARDGHIRAAAFFSGYQERNIELSVVVEDASVITRSLLRELFTYCFVTADCRRVTAKTRSRNRRAKSQLLRMGFVCEGKLKHFYTNDDALIFGLYRENCRWIRTRNDG